MRWLVLMLLVGCGTDDSSSTGFAGKWQLDPQWDVPDTFTITDMNGTLTLDHDPVWAGITTTCGVTSFDTNATAIWTDPDCTFHAQADDYDVTRDHYTLAVDGDTLTIDVGWTQTDITAMSLPFDYATKGTASRL
ncbi:MAG: hypothetical protein QM831_15945 [Kofleriaceae bacterium]